MKLDSDYAVRLAILGALGGDTTKSYDSVYEVDLAILAATQSGSGVDLETVDVLPNAAENKDKILRLSTDNQIYFAVDNSGTWEWQALVVSETQVINDNVTSSETTWSSNKLNTELASKADAADLSSYATIAYVTGELVNKANLSDLNSYATIPYVTGELASKQDILTEGAHIDITNNVISVEYEVATTAEIEALFVMVTFYIDGSLYKSYGNLTWTQWLASRYNTAGFTHIYTAATYDSSVEQIPEVSGSATPTEGGHYYSTCEDTYVPATGPADDEIWYTTKSGNLWEPMLTRDGVPESSLQYTDGGALLSNRYANGHGVLKFTNNITTVNDYFGWNDDANSDLTTITLPNSITSVGWILGQENFACPNLESVYYNGTVDECSNVNWESFNSNFGWEEIICLDGTYSLKGGGSGSGSGGSGSGSGSGGSGSGNG